MMRSWRLALILLLVSLSLVGSLATVYLALTVGDRTDLGSPVIPATLGFVFVGALIVARRPGNRVGGILLVVGVGLAVGLPIEAYAIHEHSSAGEASSVLATWAAWLGAWLWTLPIFLLFGGLPLVYPDGRLPSPRWWPVAGAVVAVAVLNAVFAAFRPGPIMIGDENLSQNPLGIDALGPYTSAIVGILDGLGPILLLLVGAAVVARWRRSRGVERQQMKWFLASVAMTTVAILLQLVRPVPEAVLWLVWLGVPVAVAIAVLRYRLYEIDRIISRTLAYALLTVTLVGVYAAGVIGLGAVVRVLTGNAGGDLVVAASTLAVAALFQPLRTRIQKVVDRRFNRARFDAQRTIDEFAQGLRDDVELAAISESLVSTAAAAMLPQAVTVWMRHEAEVPG